MINTIKNKLKDYNPYINGYQSMKISSVLIPIVKKDNIYHILFQVRSKNLKFQPSEISFPGGGVEPNETPYDAVIRETVEELGINKTDIDIISEVDLLVTHSNMIIHPFVGYIDSLDNLNINKDEVDHIFLVPISYLLDFSPSEYKNEVKIVPSEDFPYEIIPNKNNYKFISGYESTIFYEYNNYVIWGITAKILNNFLRFISS
ncbi:NUDIX hydrolase [Romboutsia sp.]|uniref:NUDIX hydrolase n=1 Tax=Romboutsia sp. TaxID=1965302 RepID=UPI003F38B7CE